MYKCCASQNGICKNMMLYGTKCEGHKEKCVLRPHYQNLEKGSRESEKCSKENFWSRKLKERRAD